MQDLNTDMEDLLRKAAEAYPLKQGEDKWTEIALRISKEVGANKVKQKPKRQLRKYYIVLLLFLLIALLLVDQGRKQNSLSIQSAKKNEAQSIPPNLIKKGNNAFLQKNSTEEKNTKDQITAEKPSITNRIEVPANNKTYFRLNPSGNKNKTKVNELLLFENENETKKIFTIRNKLVNETPFVEKDIYFNPDKVTLNINSRIKQISIPPSPFYKNESKLPGTGFYYGATAAIHLNAIKDQGFSKTGIDLGILLGYRFSKTISFESGLLFAKKIYWTPGKYFSIEEMKSSMPSGMQIIEVHGSSRTVELPLHLRIDVMKKNDHRLFSLAGFSSYLMTEENNQYHTLYNGTEANMYGTYKKDRRYFAASFDIGFGYERRLGMQNQIRFEPYLQLPIREIGIGHLPVKTVGLRLTLTRSIH